VCLSDHQDHDWLTIEDYVAEGSEALACRWRLSDARRPAWSDFEAAATYVRECGESVEAMDEGGVRAGVSVIREAAVASERARERFVDGALPSSKVWSDDAVDRLFATACDLLESRRQLRGPEQQHELLQRALLSRAWGERERATAFPSYEHQHFRPDYPATFGAYLDLLASPGTTVAYDVQSRVADFVEFVRALVTLRDDARAPTAALWTREAVARRSARCDGALPLSGRKRKRPAPS